MKQLLLVALVVAFFVVAESRSLVKREANGDYGHHDVHGYKDKQKIEDKYKLKNAILGFVFNKINSFIDQKTHWIDELDHTNIAKNKAHGIEPPADPVASLSHVLSDWIGKKLQKAGPLLTIVTNKLTAGSIGGGGHASAGGHAGAGGHAAVGGGYSFGAGVGVPVAGVHAGTSLTAGYGAI